MRAPPFSPRVSGITETSESRALEVAGTALAVACLLGAAVMVGVRGAFEPWRYLVLFGFSVYFAGKG